MLSEYRKHPDDFPGRHRQGLGRRGPVRQARLVAVLLPNRRRARLRAPRGLDHAFQRPHLLGHERRGAVRDPDAGGRVLPVITSYSIHYTKLYEPASSGRVLVNGVDLREADLAAYRARIGYVPQEALLFSGTLRDNVDLGSDAPSDELFRVSVEASYNFV